MADDAAPPVPGRHHPAVAEYAHLLPIDRPGFHVHAPRRQLLSPDLDNLGCTDVAAVRLTFTSKKATASLLPQYGHYIWRVWYDQYGRFITDPEAVWVEHPDAFIYGPWNPVVA